MRSSTITKIRSSAGAVAAAAVVGGAVLGAAPASAASYPPAVEVRAASVGQADGLVTVDFRHQVGTSALFTAPEGALLTAPEPNGVAGRVCVSTDTGQRLVPGRDFAPEIRCDSMGGIAWTYGTFALAWQSLSTTDPGAQLTGFHAGLDLDDTTVGAVDAALPVEGLVAPSALSATADGEPATVTVTGRVDELPGVSQQVVVRDSEGTVLGSVAADGAEWTLTTAAGALPVGHSTLSAATSVNGVESEATTTGIDIVASAPEFLNPTDGSGALRNIVAVGTAVPGNSVSLWNGAALIDTTTVDEDGFWRAEADEPLPLGLATLSASQTDPAHPDAVYPRSETISVTVIRLPWE